MVIAPAPAPRYPPVVVTRIGTLTLDVVVESEIARATSGVDPKKYLTEGESAPLYPPLALL